MANIDTEPLRTVQLDGLVNLQQTDYRELIDDLYFISSD